MELLPHIPFEAFSIILPAFIEVINKKVEDFNKSPLTEADRTVVSFLVCFFFVIPFNLDALRVGSIAEFVQSFTLVFTITYAMFKLYWKDSHFRGRLQEKFYGNANVEEEREPETMGKN